MPTINYNAMTETSKLKKYLMWNKVKELFSSGLNKSQIGLSLGLHRQTVSKYLSMTEDYTTTIPLRTTSVIGGGSLIIS